MPNYALSVGMEVHAELSTRSKMFCRCPVAFGGEPNTRTCPVCLGLPGTLPVPNHEAVQMVLKTALALNCNIARHSVFHRKNYFYPDLPKGYQVSQYGETNPIGYSGHIVLPSGKRVRIRRVHLEEDTGKLMHLSTGGSGIDFNRAGTPLMEIVTDFPPDIENQDEAREYLTELRQILVYLGVCDGKMEEGSLRCEPNISIRPVGASILGTKTELKNLNSFRSVQLGVAFEARRQEAVLDSGGAVAQETRGWNEQKEASYLMRVKEEENDYRYFPDPDLAVMTFSEEDITDATESLPELPSAKSKRYQEVLGLSPYDAGILTADREWSEFFEEAVELGGEPKAVCNWLSGDLAKLLNGSNLRPREGRVKPVHLVELTKLISEGTINGKTAKQLIDAVFTTGRAPSELLQESGATQISDEAAIEEVVRTVLTENPELCAKFNAGQANVKGFLVGQVMKRTQGRANPKLVQDLVTRALNGS